VTEIPEHLLKRSRERRAALGLGGEAAAEAAPSEQAGAAATPATTGEAAPAPAASSGPAPRAAAQPPATPPPPPPDSPVVAAFKARRRMPFWAMAAVSLLPLWGFMYVRSLTEQAEAVAGPIGVGAEVYGSCASCHGGTGGGGVGYALADGEVLATFPHIEDHIRFVYFGTAAYNVAGVEIYGNPDREGGPHITGALGPMPAWGAEAAGELTDAELLAVVCHERYTLGGADPSAEFAEEFELWCSEESEIFAGLEGGELMLTTLEESVDGIIPIGTEPVPGSPPEAG
jgi:mono/diheme cytochrome c family protein